jgi:hypothetical protein
MAVGGHLVLESLDLASRELIHASVVCITVGDQGQHKYDEGYAIHVLHEVMYWVKSTIHRK